MDALAKKLEEMLNAMVPTCSHPFRWPRTDPVCLVPIYIYIYIYCVCVCVCVCV